MIKNHDEHKKRRSFAYVVLEIYRVENFYCDVIQCKKTLSLYKSTIKSNKEDIVFFDKIGQFA